MILEIKFRAPPRPGRPTTLRLHTHEGVTPKEIKDFMEYVYGVRPKSVRRVDQFARELYR